MVTEDMSLGERIMHPSFALLKSTNRKSRGKRLRACVIVTPRKYGQVDASTSGNLESAFNIGIVEDHLFASIRIWAQMRIDENRCE
jgi:hypothetical protein